MESLPSTNTYAWNLIDKGKESGIILTSNQYDGKGQRNNNWLSSIEGGITFSLFLNRKLPSNQLGILPILAGLSIQEAMLNHAITVSLKWPNDIYHSGEKLAGILIENNIYKGNQLVLIGVGVNFQLVDKHDIETSWVDLSRILTKLPSFQKLTAAIINNILMLSEDFQLNGLTRLLSQWDHYDMLKGVRIKLRESNIEFEGQIDGISEQGALKVITKDGVKELYSSMHIEYI